MHVEKEVVIARQPGTSGAKISALVLPIAWSMIRRDFAGQLASLERLLEPGA